ncbi:hypothetical protein MAR_021633 [Mya arenaria]|uniref:Uncharacterized protein n=1 Tax=Mya arenaria TaxID=6604 RepID=A0ABY7EAX3_MYAAR|nr:hypothetical protein MAR_021633 [Mya arenaria]
MSRPPILSCKGDNGYLTNETAGPGPYIVNMVESEHMVVLADPTTTVTFRKPFCSYSPASSVRPH